MLVVWSTALTSCMVGPNFRKPLPPTVDRYTYPPFPPKTVSIKKAGRAGVSQHFQLCNELPTEWWKLFHSKELTDLIYRGLLNSPTLGAAEAALWQAQEALIAQIGSTMFPQVDLSLGAARGNSSSSTSGTGSFGATNSSTNANAGTATNSSSGSSGGSSGNIFSVYNASVNVSYTLDVFGGLRRQIEALGAQVHFQEFELLGAYLTLTSNIASTALNIASLRAQILATKDLIKDEEDQLKILRMQFKLGGISEVNVATQENLVEQTRATLPVLEQNLAKSKHALAVLVGTYPSAEIPELHLNALTLPDNLPVSLSSELVRQRPDVRASEALLHAACAEIGVATANLFPQINLTGNYGYEGVIGSQLSSHQKVWGLAASLTQPLFHGGALLAQRREAVAAYRQAAAQYVQTALQAFQNVADALRALENDAKTLQAEKAAEMSAKRLLELTQSQYKYGSISYIDLLIAQVQYHRALIARIQAQATRYTDTIALFQALGGGWWNSPSIPYGRGAFG